MPLGLPEFSVGAMSLLYQVLRRRLRPIGGATAGKDIRECCRQYSTLAGLVSMATGRYAKCKGGGLCMTWKPAVGRWIRGREEIRAP
jgi:hypothetical protein